LTLSLSPPPIEVCLSGLASGSYQSSLLKPRSDKSQQHLDIIKSCHPAFGCSLPLGLHCSRSTTSYLPGRASGQRHNFLRPQGVCRHTKSTNRNPPAAVSKVTNHPPLDLFQSSSVPPSAPSFHFLLLTDALRIMSVDQVTAQIAGLLLNNLSTLTNPPSSVVQVTESSAFGYGGQLFLSLFSVHGNSSSFRRPTSLPARSGLVRRAARAARAGPAWCRSSRRQEGRTTNRMPFAARVPSSPPCRRRP
jgi:hypothetical protein